MPITYILKATKILIQKNKISYWQEFQSHAMWGKTCSYISYATPGNGDGKIMHRIGMFEKKAKKKQGNLSQE